VYSSVYPGWQQVENSAIAVAETANLILIPGRKDALSCRPRQDVLVSFRRKAFEA
jgi:hypothetical protein